MLYVTFTNRPSHGGELGKNCMKYKRIGENQTQFTCTLCCSLLHLFSLRHKLTTARMWAQMRLFPNPYPDPHTPSREKPLPCVELHAPTST